MQEFINSQGIDLQCFAEGDTQTDTDTFDGGNDDSGTGEFNFDSLFGDDNQDNDDDLGDNDLDNQDQNVGEEKMVPQSEVNRIITERLNRERQKYQGFNETQAQIQRLQQYGYELNDIVDFLQQRALEEQSQETGLPVEAVQKLSEYEQRLSHFEQMEQQRIIQQEFEDMRNHSELGDFFKQNESDIANLADARRVNLETATALLFANKFPEIRQQIVQSGEQQAIRNVQQRANTVVDNSTQSNNNGGVELSPEQMAIAKSLGVNPQDYAKNLKRR